MSINTQTLVGNVGGDPELRFTPSGLPVINFSLAVSRRVRAEDGTWDNGPTTWYRVSAWRKLAEHLADSLSKGDRVIVIGQVENREYEDKDGNKRTSLEIKAEDVGISALFNPVKSERASYSHNQAPAATEEVPF